MAIQHRNHALTVWRSHRYLPAGTKLVLYALADRMRSNDCCDVSVRQLADQCGVSPTTAQKAITDLRELNIIVSEGNGRPGHKLRHHYMLPAGFDWESNAHRKPGGNHRYNPELHRS